MTSALFFGLTDNLWIQALSHVTHNVSFALYKWALANSAGKGNPAMDKRLIQGQ